MAVNKGRSTVFCHSCGNRRQIHVHDLIRFIGICGHALSAHLLSKLLPLTQRALQQVTLPFGAA
jgi:hypothetical protein